MSVATIQSLFAQKCAEAMVSILPAFVAGLKSKYGIDTTVDELASMGALPVTNSVSIPSSNNSVSRVSNNSASTGTCTYIFSRGANAGKVCGKPAIAGRDRCNQCKGKGKSKPKEKTPTGTTKTKSKAEGVPTGFSNAAPEPTINAAKWEHDKSYVLIEGPFPFLVRDEGKEVVCYGKAAGDKIVPLEPADEAEAAKMSLVVKRGNMTDHKEVVSGSSSSAAAPVTSLYGSAPGGPSVTSMMPVVNGMHMPLANGQSSSNGVRIM